MKDSSCIFNVFLNKKRSSMKSPVVKFVGMITWLITAVCALHVGMQALGHDLFMRFGLEANPMVNLYAQYVCGVAGAISLVMYVMALTCKNCCCGEKGCSCGAKGSNGYCSKCGSAPCRCGK